MNEKLNGKILARIVMRAPSVHPKSGAVEKEIVFTVRPGWSNIGKYENALPGGKIEDNDLLSEEKERDVESLDLIAIGLRAIIREVLEELDYLIDQSSIVFVTSDTNEAGWTTYYYAVDLAEKPMLSVDSESAGTLWVGEAHIKDGTAKVFADHLAFTLLAIETLDSKKTEE